MQVHRYKCFQHILKTVQILPVFAIRYEIIHARLILYCNLCISVYLFIYLITDERRIILRILQKKSMAYPQKSKQRNTKIQAHNNSHVEVFWDSRFFFYSKSVATSKYLSTIKNHQTNVDIQLPTNLSNLLFKLDI